VNSGWLVLSLFFVFLLYFLIGEFFCHILGLRHHLPQSPVTSSQSAGAPPRTESQDSERTVSEATVGEAMAKVDEAVMESPNPAMTMIMAEKFASKVAGASTAQDTTLVVVSTPLPTSSPVGHASSSQCLEDVMWCWSLTPPIICPR
jgi:hypothetical protein